MSRKEEKERLIPASESLDFDDSDLQHDNSAISNGPVNKRGKKRRSKRHGSEHYSAGMLSFATPLDWLLLALGTVASVVHGAGMPVLSIVFGGMTNVFLGVQKNVTQTQGQGEAVSAAAIEAENAKAFDDAVFTYCLYYTYIGVAMFVTSYIQIACFESACERQLLRLRRTYFRSVLRQQIVWFDRRQTGETASRLNDDMERVREGLGDKASLFVQFFSAFIAGFLVGFIYEWRLTLVMISIAPLLAMCGAWMAKISSSRTKDEQQCYAVAGGIASEALSNIRTVTAFNGYDREVKRYEAALHTGRKSGLKKYMEMSIGMLITFTLQFGAYGLAFWYGSVLILDDPTFERGTIFTVFFSVMNGSFSLGNALPHLNNIAMARGAAHNILETIKSIPKIDPYSEKGLKPENTQGKLEFKSVKFSYPLRPDVPVLDDLSFTCAPGEKLAVVGASGCGKSTLVQLLLRFYDPANGNVLVDDIDCRQYNVRHLRRLFGVVSQEPVLFDGTLEENIRLATPDASHKQVHSALKQANADEFIARLPEGMQTRVGERGVQLSGGQKQRIAIARALLAEPKIMLLDEATSALDTTSEKLVQEALNKAAAGRTTLTIAHRLSTIRDADRILVLRAGGQIIQQGDYNTLMQDKDGEFYSMVMAQQLDNAAKEKDEPEEEASDNEDEARDVFNGDLIGPNDIERKGTSVSRYTHDTVSGVSSAMSYYRPPDLESKLEPSSFGKMFMFNRQSWGWFVIGMLGNLLSGVVMPAFSLLFSQVFQVYSESGEQLRRDAIFWSLMFLLIGLLNGVGFFIAANALGRAGENMTLRMRLAAFAAMMRAHVAYFDDERHSTGAITTRLSTDAPSIRYVFTRLPLVLTSTVTIVAGVLIAFIFGWRMALVLTIMLPLLIGSSYVEFRLQFDRQLKDAHLLEAAGRTVSEAVGNIRTVQGLATEQVFYERYSSQLVEPFRSNMRMAQTYGFAFAFAQCVPFFLYAAGFRYGGYLISIELMQPLDVFRVFFAVAFCGTTFGQLSSFIPDVVKARIAAAHLFKMIETPSYIDPVNGGGARPSLKGSIELKKVRFSYPTRPGVRVLNRLSLKIPAGQTVALVGPSGCGKSTVVGLLERFYDVGRGNVDFDGWDVRKVDVKHLREQMGLVSQEPVLFDTTIEQNISYGLVDVTHEQVVKAAELANIHNFILSLPLGYQTPVGERGTQLSGGQKQRIAIARALMRDPKVLLLDEATSALDTESEKVVQVALEQARHGRTCVVIAHRLSTVQSADLIAVIRDGRVVERGTHQELLDKKGLYHALCQHQKLVD